MKKNFKRFFTLKHKANEGFTLVELIVVIAILAILGGVAVPAYSGYIKKADRAADEVLLNAVNKAFVSACMANGENNYFRTDVVANIEDGQLAYTAPFEPEFTGFYEGGTFKVYTGLYYDKNLGMFAEGYVLTYNGVPVVLSQEDVQKLKDSAFAEIGPDKLLTMIDMAADLIDSANPNSTLGQLANSDAAKAFLYKTLGVTNDNDVYDILAQKYPQEEGMSDEAYGALLIEKYNQVVSNNAVLYSAQKSQAASEGIWDVLKAGSVKDAIKANENSEEQMAQSAMAFAMYSAYTKTDSIEGVELGDVYATLDSAEFKAYLETKQAKDDLDGYLASMNMVNDSVAGNNSAAQNILLNGFSDDQLANLMGEMINN